MSISSGKSKRHRNPKIDQLSSLNTNIVSLDMSDLVNNNRNIPRVSINSTSQLCLSQDARIFPYMQVGTFYFPFISRYSYMNEVSVEKLHL